jgi:hypothetical protein
VLFTAPDTPPPYFLFLSWKKTKRLKKAIKFSCDEGTSMVNEVKGYGLASLDSPINVSESSSNLVLLSASSFSAASINAGLYPYNLFGLLTRVEGAG